MRRLQPNKIADHWQDLQKQPEAMGGSDAMNRLANLPVNEPSEIEELQNPRNPGSLYQRALSLIQERFHERTWKAFWGVAIDGRNAVDVADELGMSVNAVYIAKTRVLHGLRQELGDLLR